MQPYVEEAATLGAGGCNPMCAGVEGAAHDRAHLAAARHGRPRYLVITPRPSYLVITPRRCTTRSPSAASNELGLGLGLGEASNCLPQLPTTAAYHSCLPQLLTTATAITDHLLPTTYYRLLTTGRPRPGRLHRREAAVRLAAGTFPGYHP